jgi:hypothetical protein
MAAALGIELIVRTIQRAGDEDSRSNMAPARNTASRAPDSPGVRDRLKQPIGRTLARKLANSGSTWQPNVHLRRAKK